jgi:GNAT superfamily N-acetyltransferase
MLARAAAGSPPVPDGGLTVLAQPADRDAGVIAFTAHSVVFADVAAEWVRARLPAGDVAAPLSPSFLLALGEQLGRMVANIDMLTVAAALPGHPRLALTEITDTDHPRVQRARRYRDELTIWTGGGAIVMIGRGIASRWEVAIEVDPGLRGRGVGRRAARAARHLVPGGEPLWAQIAPGNAASVRAFLAAGFVPVGAEALVVRA